MKLIPAAALVLILSTNAASSATAVVCSAVEDILWTIDEIEGDASGSTRVNALAVTRLSIGAMQALGRSQAFADEGELPPEITQALETIRDSLRADADMPFEEARPRILESGIAIVAAMAGPCPDADRECLKLCVSDLAHAVFQIRSGVEAPGEHYGQLISGGNPFPDRAPALLEIADGQEDQLRGGLLGGE